MNREHSDTLVNVHPGILLKEDFLDELHITPYRLAKDIGLTPIHITELLRGKRNITPSTALLLGKYFGTTAEYFINLQSRYDLIEAQRTIGDKLDKITPIAA
jgi:addiction module HigA family antidote